MFTIGKLAAKTGVRPDTIRYYESEGLMNPADRNESGYRVYDAETIRSVLFIRQAKECGFTLEEIRNLLLLRHQKSAMAKEIQQRVLEKKVALDRRIKTMRSMSRTLGRLADLCCERDQPADECPILLAFEEPSQLFGGAKGGESGKHRLYGSEPNHADKSSDSHLRPEEDPCLPIQRT